MSTRFKEKIVDGQVLFDNVTPQLTDSPQLAADHTSLGSSLAQARDLQGRQETVKGQLRDINQQRLQVAKQTDDLRRRLRAGLISVLGPDSTKLLEFGIKPRRQKVQRVRLTPAAKAARAAERAVARAAVLAAAEKPKEASAKPATP
ncbi:MAG TPA: hypothetical protein VIH93_00450 [Thermoanaerobaculia bacterium]